MSSDVLSRYEIAQSLMLGVLSNEIVMNDAVFPHWIAGSECFWYKRDEREGAEYRLVDVSLCTNEPAFDHGALASALEKACGRKVNCSDLPIGDISIDISPLKIKFTAYEGRWLYEHGKPLSKCKTEIPNALLSPDGESLAFVRESNIWIKDVNTGEQRALTQDGVTDLFYAGTPHEAMLEMQAVWSPDSKYLLATRFDMRKVRSRNYIQYVPEDGSYQSRLTKIKNAFPGEEHVEQCDLVVLDINSDEILEINISPIPMYGFGKFFSDNLGWWSADSLSVYVVDVERGAKKVRLLKLDLNSGGATILFEEESETFVKLNHTTEDVPIFLPIPESDELIWFSERTGWGHLYLYDLITGKLKNVITEGQWVLRELLHYDSDRREVIVQTSSRDSKISPYYCDVCKVQIDTGELTPIVTGNFEHFVYQHHSISVFARSLSKIDSADVCGVSPDGNYVVVTRSRVDTIPVSEVYHRSGKKVMCLEEADVSALPKGWQWPEPVTIKGADNKTDIYGVVFRPPDFDSNESYPVLDFACGMRGYSMAPVGSFTNGACFGYPYLLASAFASLGFIVVALKGRGTPQREKAFQDHNYGMVSSIDDFSDHVFGIRQLAERFPYMDLTRVGISGMDGLATPVYGLLNFPDFYKVSVVHCFWEPVFHNAVWGETYEDINVNEEGGKAQLAENLVERLAGKLLLIFGMCEYPTPVSSFRLVEALRIANKDFDMLCLPNLNTNISSYALRRNWDYLVTHLIGEKPPKEFRLVTGEDKVKEKVEMTNLGSST